MTFTKGKLGPVGVIVVIVLYGDSLTNGAAVLKAGPGLDIIVEYGG